MAPNRRGFTLIELLIVVSIILIIAAIAIPDLLKSKSAANQASTVGSLRIVIAAEVSYNSTYTSGYSSTLEELDGTTSPATSLAAGLMDGVLGSGTKSGYNFYYVPCVVPAVPNDGTLTPGTCGATISVYQVSANPASGPGFGNYYFTDNSGVIRQKSGTPAGPGDAPVAG